MYLKLLYFAFVLVGPCYSAVTLADLTAEAKPAPTEDIKTSVAPELKVIASTVAPEPKIVTPLSTASPTSKVISTSTPVAPETKETESVSSTTAAYPSPSTLPAVVVSDANTTTVAPPTPTPAPAHQPGQWFVKENNVTCIIAKMLINLTIPYQTKDNATSFVVVPIEGNGKSIETKGSCGVDNQTLTIGFGLGHSLQLTFKNRSSQFTISSIQLTVNASDLPNSIANGTILYNESKPIFETPITMSYKCNKLQTVHLINPQTNLTAMFNVTDTQLQAFRKDNSSDKFANAQDCQPLDTPDMVPIAVGVSLGVMILVVLIAYLIGRNRTNRGTGYVSM